MYSLNYQKILRVFFLLGPFTIITCMGNEFRLVTVRLLFYK